VGTPRAEIEAINDGATDWPQIESFDFATLGDIPLAPSSYEGLTWQSDLQELIPSGFGLFSQSNELPAVFSSPGNVALEHQIFSPRLSPSAVTNDHEKSLSSDRMIEEGLQIILTQFGGDSSSGRSDLATALESVTTGTEDAFQSASSKNYSNYLQIYVYLASNNLLSDFSTQKLILLIAKTHSHSMLKVLLESITTSIEIFMSTLLVSAAAVGDAKICRMLIEAGVDLDAHSGLAMRTTALHRAVSNYRTECVKMILEAGADPNLVVDGKTPLHNACSYLPYQSAFDIVDLLLQHGARVNPPQDCARLTPLQLAVRTGNPELVRLLLDKGADPNLFTTSKIGTALQMACTISKNAIIVELLINAGADVDSYSGYQFHAREENDYADSDAESYSSDEDEDDGIDFLIGNSVKSPILLAAENENWEAVQLLLEEGAAINAGLKKRPSRVLQEELKNFETPVLTPLQAAVRAENITMTRMLLANGAHVNQKMEGKHGFTALQIGATVGNERLVDILLRKGAAINAPAGVYYGRTALQAAASHLDTRLMSLLLREGADVNAHPARSEGRTALQIAAAAGNIEGVRMLLDAKATVNIDPSLTGGVTTLEAGFMDTDQVVKAEIVHLLLRAGASPGAHKIGQEQYAPLHSAVRREDLSMARRLLEGGASPNIGFCDSEVRKKTPLQRAAFQGNNDMVQELIKHGAEVNAPPYRKGGHTALQAAALMGHESTVKILLSFGADIKSEIASVDGGSAIQASVRGENDLITRLLLEKEPDAISSDPITKCRIIGEALASWKCDVSLLEFLLKGGASAGETANSASMSFLQAAIQRHSFQLVECLVSAGANVNHHWKRKLYGLVTPLQSAVQRKHDDIVGLLLQRGADVNAPANENGGQTALQIAVSQNNHAMVKLLISHKADVNGMPSPARGRSALQEAASRGFVGLTQYLLDCGADPNLPAARLGGFTALQGAAIEGKIRIVIMLIQAGAHVNAAPAIKQGRSATEGAAENGRLHTLHLLLDHHPDTEEFDIIRKRAARLALANGHLAIGRFLMAYRKHAWRA
jgi:ankyrin repeat protein